MKGEKKLPGIIEGEKRGIGGNLRRRRRRKWEGKNRAFEVGEIEN